mgnify:CR=1 FL=1
MATEEMPTDPIQAAKDESAAIEQRQRVQRP